MFVENFRHSPDESTDTFLFTEPPDVTDTGGAFRKWSRNGKGAGMYEMLMSNEYFFPVGFEVPFRYQAGGIQDDTG